MWWSLAAKFLGVDNMYYDYEYESRIRKDSGGKLLNGLKGRSDVSLTKQRSAFKDLYGFETILFIKEGKVHLGKVQYKIWYSAWCSNYRVTLNDKDVVISEDDVIHSFGRSSIGWGVVDLETKIKSA